MLFLFSTKRLYTESIKSPACSIICHKFLHATTNGNWWLLVVTIHAPQIFSLLLSPCKLRSHMVRKMGLEPIRSCEHQHLKLACLPIPALSLIASFHICTLDARGVFNGAIWRLRLVGKVGLEPTTTEVTGLQPAAIPITLYLPINRRIKCRRTNCIGFYSLYRTSWHVQWRPTVLTPGKRPALYIFRLSMAIINALLIKTISSCRFLTHILIIP